MNNELLSKLRDEKGRFISYKKETVVSTPKAQEVIEIDLDNALAMSNFMRKHGVPNYLSETFNARFRNIQFGGMGEAIYAYPMLNEAVPVLVFYPPRAGYALMKYHTATPAIHGSGTPELTWFHGSGNKMTMKIKPEMFNPVTDIDLTTQL